MTNVTFFSKSSYYLCLLFALSLPIFVKALPGIIALWVLSLTIQAILSRKIRVYFSTPMTLILVLYMLYVIGILWSADKDAGRFALEVKFSLFLFPFIIGTSKEFFRENLIRILLAFILGCIVASLVCLSVAFWQSTFFAPSGIRFDSIDPDFASWEFGGSHFRYINLSLFLHPGYFSLYLLFALISSILMLRRKILTNSRLIYVLYAAIPLFLLMIYLLSSKAVLICTLILLVIYSVALFIQQRNSMTKIAISFISIILLITAIQNPRFSTITQVIQNPGIITDKESDGSFISRVHIWKAGLEIIGENFIAGVGPGDTNDELVKKYDVYQFNDPKRIRANAHSQFLETFIDLGLMGFLVLLAALVYPFRKSYKNRNVLFLLFLFITGFSFLFETMLNTQAGVIFFSFFYCLLSIIGEGDFQTKASGIQPIGINVIIRKRRDGKTLSQKSRHNPV